MMKGMLKSRRGISLILATLLLIVIAVAAVAVTYAWIMTLTGSTTTQSGAVLKVDNMRFHNVSSTDYVEIILKNFGTTDAKVESVYVGTSDSALILQNRVSYNPSSQIVVPGSSLNITITYNWTDGTRYYFKMATEGGITIPYNYMLNSTFVFPSFQRNADFQSFYTQYYNMCSR